mgnify:FL=1
MGEANMKFARGEYHEVIMMCQEIIKLGAKILKTKKTEVLVLNYCLSPIRFPHNFLAAGVG